MVVGLRKTCLPRSTDWKAASWIYSSGSGGTEGCIALHSPHARPTDCSWRLLRGLPNQFCDIDYRFAITGTQTTPILTYMSSNQQERRCRTPTTVRILLVQQYLGTSLKVMGPKFVRRCLHCITLPNLCCCVRVDKHAYCFKWPIGYWYCETISAAPRLVQQCNSTDDSNEFLANVA